MNLYAFKSVLKLTTLFRTTADKQFQEAQPQFTNKRISRQCKIMHSLKQSFAHFSYKYQFYNNDIYCVNLSPGYTVEFNALYSVFDYATF